jgi:hypothetical protein
MNHQDFLNILQASSDTFDPTSSTYKQIPDKHTITQHILRPFNHTVYSITQQKTGLSCIDTKRYVLPNGSDTLPYGHIDIQTIYEPQKHEILKTLKSVNNLVM